MSTADNVPLLDVGYALARPIPAGLTFPRVDVAAHVPTRTEAEAIVATAARAAMLAEEARLVELIRILADLDDLGVRLVADRELLRFTGHDDELTVVVDVYTEDLTRAADPIDVVVDRLCRAIEAGR